MPQNRTIWTSLRVRSCSGWEEAVLWGEGFFPPNVNEIELQTYNDYLIIVIKGKSKELTSKLL